MLIDGQSGSIVGLNTIGLRRAGYSADELTQLKAARVIYRRGLPWAEVLETLKTDFTTGLASHLHTFLAQEGEFVQERRSPPSSAATLRIQSLTKKTQHTKSWLKAPIKRSLEQSNAASDDGTSSEKLLIPALRCVVD